MTKATFDSKMTTDVSDVLAPHVDTLMAHLRAGKVDTLHVVGTLVPSERTEPTPGAEKEASVKLRLVSAEIPTGDQVEPLREVQRALWLARTATGTLDENGEVQLARHTLQHAGEQMAYTALATLRAGVDQWRKEARKAIQGRLSASEMWHEMERIESGLAALLGERPAGDEDDEQLALDDE